MINEFWLEQYSYQLMNLLKNTSVKCPVPTNENKNTCLVCTRTEIFKINIKINFQAGGLLMEMKLKTNEECPRE